MSEVTKKQFLAFIQKKNKPAKPGVLAYYEAAFEKSQEKRFFINWNWAAFLLNFYWMTYRGMYLYAALYIGSCTVPYLAVTPYLQSSPELSLITILPALAIWILIGLYGASLYIYWAKCQISKGKHVGVSFWRPFAAFFIYVGLSTALTGVFLGLSHPQEDVMHKVEQPESEDILSEF